jgi:hypothetical protein
MYPTIQGLPLTEWPHAGLARAHVTKPRPKLLLQLWVLNGWGGFLLTEIDYVNIFLSHDEYINFFACEDSDLEDVRKEFLHTNTNLNQPK